MASVLTPSRKGKVPKQYPPLTPERWALVHSHRDMAFWFQAKYWSWLPAYVGGEEEMGGYLMFFLCEAAQRFDFGYGTKFGTLLTSHLTWRLRNLAREFGPTAKGGETRPRVVSLTDAVADADGTPPWNMVPDPADPDAEIDARLAAVRVGELLAGLSPVESEIIRLRHGIGRDGRPLTLREVGVLLGKTKERVRQIQKRATKKLRKAAGVAA